MLPFPLLGRARSWGILCLASFLSLLAFSTPCAAQYPGGGYPGGGGGYPGGGGSYGGPDYSASTGQITFTASPGPPAAPRNYSLTSNGYGGSYYASGGSDANGANISSGTVTCSGPITATFTWNNGGDPNSKPPKCVIVTEHCVAGWSGEASGGATATGNCTNPLGGSSVPADPGPGATWDYTRYTVQNDPPATLVISCSPEADAAAAGSSTPGSHSVNGAGVTYSVSVSPVTVVPGGLMLDGSTLKVLTGQPISATLSAPYQVDPASYKWSATGDVFYTYNEHAPSHQLILLSDDPSYTNQPQFGFYDKSADTITITCSATIVCPDGTRLPVTVTAPNITSVKPSASWDTGRSKPSVGFHSTPQGMGAIEVWDPITITVPQPFSGGTGCLAQLITPVRRLTRNALNGQTANYYFKIPQQNSDGTTTMVLPSRGLDGAFPYPGFNGGAATWDVSGSGASGDGPAMAYSTPPLDNGGSAWTRAYANDIFTTYLMYQPPGGIWVPIQRLDWGWHGDADNSTGSWGATGSDFMGPNGSDTANPPQWDVVIEANDQLYP